MSTPQRTVDSKVTQRTKVNESVVSNSDTETLKSLFPGSPIHSGELADGTKFGAADIKSAFKSGVVKGNTGSTGDFPDGVDLGYAVEDLDLSNVETGGEGKPASPHVPNPVSPGQGSVDPSKQAAAPEGFGTVRSDVPFSGPGSKLDPKEAAQKITDQDIEELLLGESGAVEKPES